MSGVNAGRFVALRAAEPLTSVSVYNHDTATLASLYTDNSSGTAAPNPLQADPFGNFQFFAVPGDVDVVLRQGASQGATTITVTVPADPTEAWPG